MPDNILAIYDNVEPNLELTLPQRRDMAISEESTGSVESDDCDCNVFHIFHQFAALMYYKGDYQDEIEIAMSDTDEWADTGFAIVSDVISGSACVIWLIINFWAYDPASSLSCSK